MNSLLRKSAFAFAVAAMSASAYSADTFEGKTKDAWLTGKVETIFLLNRHLNGFKIDTDIENGIVVLTGTVESDIDRDLAETLAESVDGVVDVRNMLEVDSATAREERAAAGGDDGRSFG